MALKRINKQLLKRSIKWVIALAALTGIIFGVVPLFSYSLSRILFGLAGLTILPGIAGRVISNLRKGKIESKADEKFYKEIEKGGKAVEKQYKKNKIKEEKNLPIPSIENNKIVTVSNIFIEKNVVSKGRGL